MIKDDQKYDWYYRFAVYLVTIVLVVLLGVLLYVASDVMFLLLAAILWGVVLNRLSSWLSEKGGLPYKAALGIWLLVIISLMIVLVWFGQHTISEQAKVAIEGSQKTIDKIQEYYAQSDTAKKVGDALPAQTGGGQLWQTVTRFLASSFGVVGNALFIFVVGIFFAVDPFQYRNGAVRFFPQSRRKAAEDFLNSAGDALFHWTLGQSFAMLVIAIMTTVSLMVLQVPGAIFLGLFAGLISFIPTVGAILAIVPAILLSLQQGTSTALMVIAIYTVIQLVESNFLTPMVQQRQINLAPAVLITAQLFAALVFGFLGLAMIAPLLAVVVVFLEDFYFPSCDKDESVVANIVE